MESNEKTPNTSDSDISTSTISTNTISTDKGLALAAIDVSKSLRVGEETISILSDINLAIEAGETCAIVGASGSGKTTLLGVLASMDAPDTGEINLLSLDESYSIYQYDEDWRAGLRGQEMGFVFQNFQLIADMTALDNVLLPLELAGINDISIAKGWLDKVGLSHRLDHYPRQLSGGEQQRVALARAFVNSPRLLFADEPTGSLDETTAATMIELLFELNKTTGSTMVMVTHDPVLAARCDKVYRLSAGSLVNDSESYNQTTPKRRSPSISKRKARAVDLAASEQAELPEQHKLL